MNDSVPDIPTDSSSDSGSGRQREKTDALISEVERAGNVTQELTSTAFESDRAQPSEILPTHEGPTLFRGVGAEQNDNAEHSRRNGWHPDATLERVQDWIVRRRRKHATPADPSSPAADPR